jgi:hypothetical protein
MNTKAVPAVIRPMLNALPVCPERLRARVSAITTKPARLRMLKPEMISLVSIDPASIVLLLFHSARYPKPLRRGGDERARSLVGEADSAEADIERLFLKLPVRRVGDPGDIGAPPC